MIDIVKDYAAIGVGTVQAGTARIAGLGRGTAQVVGDLGAEAPGLLDPRVGIACARDVVGHVLAGDVEAVLNQIGLAKKSEVAAVRLQLQRIERRLADPRGDR